MGSLINSTNIHCVDCVNPLMPEIKNFFLVCLFYSYILHIFVSFRCLYNFFASILNIKWFLRPYDISYTGN